MMGTVLYLLVCLAASYLLVPLWVEILKIIGHLQVNYRGEAIPQSMGTVYLPVFTLAAFFARWMGLLAGETANRALVAAFGFALLGFVDDIWGDGRARGFRGHLRLLARGEVSTGFLKALGGLAVALWAVHGLSGIFPLLVFRAAILALSANFLNLLDLRPGRALKIFFLLSLIYAWQLRAETGLLLLFPLLITSLVLFPLDLQGKVMLGDAGANMLGALLGLAVVLEGTPIFSAVWLLALLLLHLLAEQFSLTKIIAANRLLRFFDMLGRDNWEK